MKRRKPRRASKSNGTRLCGVIRERVNPNSVELRPVVTRKKIGEQSVLFFWYIFWNATRAGKVYICSARRGTGVEEPFITVILNLPMQGRGIGAIAFTEACRLSGLSTIYAVVRKSHRASQKALKAAGFLHFANNASGEDVLRWTASHSQLG
jgi:hypothetical protein